MSERPRESLYTREEQLLTRIRVFQAEIAEQKFHHTACPLLASQLLEAEVMVSKFNMAVYNLRKSLKESGASGFHKETP